VRSGTPSRASRLAFCVPLAPQRSHRTGRHILNPTLVRFLGLAPGLALAALYGRITGDFANASAVMALLFGLWFGTQLGRGNTRIES
jgi:hypothetical protein